METSKHNTELLGYRHEELEWLNEHKHRNPNKCGNCEECIGNYVSYDMVSCGEEDYQCPDNCKEYEQLKTRVIRSMSNCKECENSSYLKFLKKTR